MFYKVNVGWSWRCGGEDFTLIVEARDEDDARAKATIWRDAHNDDANRWQVGRDIESVQFKDGIAVVYYDYWER